MLYKTVMKKAKGILKFNLIENYIKSFTDIGLVGLVFFGSGQGLE